MSALPVSPPDVAGGPELMFRVGPVRFPDGRPEADAEVGPWLGDRGAPFTLGALGVLVDDVLGLAIISRRPPEHWSVSTEITIDRLALRCGDADLTARSEDPHVTATGGLAAGLVLSGTGGPLARATQRGRFVPASPTRALPPTVVATPRVAGPGSLVGLELVSGGGSLVVTAELENPLTNLHGGIALCASDLCASAALDDGGPELVTASIHMSYLRPVPAGAVLELRAEVVHRGRTLAVVDVVGVVLGKPCTRARVVAQAWPG